MEKSENLMPLREWVAALRAELLAAHEDGLASGNAEAGPRFVVGPVNVEFTVAAKREAGANGGIKFYVFQLGASGSVATESTQRVSLALTPLTKEGEPYDMSSSLLDKPK
ncbi:MAG: trypco2 family protein [Streptosporangiaceae bacterium]